MGEMLHDASGRTWRQTMFVPAAGSELERSEVAVEVLGRFASHGGFELTQTPRRINVHIVHDGDGTVTMGGGSWRVRAGSVFCFYPGHFVHYADRRERPWRYTWIGLVGTSAEALSSRIGGQSGPWCRDDLPVAQVTGLLDAIEAAFRSEDHSPFYPQAAAWRLLDGLSPRSAGEDRTGHLAVAVRRILDEQFAAPLKLGALARQLGVDRSTVFRRFQALYGSPPKTYLDRLRLDHAAALLRDGALGVAEVAGRCGYASAHRFAKAFRSRFGVAPTRYRGSPSR
jgi:AraC-like DNA-binding protein